MKKCLNCKYWDRVNINSLYIFVEKYYKYDYRNDKTIEKDYDFLTGYCKNHLFCKSLENSNDFGLHDASEYDAKMYTGQDFFCAKWEKK